MPREPGTTRPYAVSLDWDGRYYSDGPGDCFSYHAGTLWPNTRFGDDKELAARVTEFMNRAYYEGYIAAKLEIRKALGFANG